MNTPELKDPPWPKKAPGSVGAEKTGGDENLAAQVECTPGLPVNGGPAPIPAVELLSRKISFFQNVATTTPKDEITVREILGRVKSGEWAEPVARIRNAREKSGKKAADALKKSSLPAATFSGTFKQRENAGLLIHSGILCVDIDGLNPSCVTESKRRLASDPHVLAVFASPSGTGLKVLVPILATNEASHKACYMESERYFKTTLGLVSDPSGKDVARLCFASRDPDLWTALDSRGPGGLVSPFCLNPVTEICTSVPCTLNAEICTTVLCKTDGEQDALVLVRAEAEVRKYLAENLKTSPIVTRLYSELIWGRWRAKPHERNNWLCEAIPFLFRAFSKAVGEELALIHLRAYRSLYAGGEDEHRASFDSLWNGAAFSYLAELTQTEREIYLALGAHEQDAFRICRDLAGRGADWTFFHASDYLGCRIARPGEANGYRILQGFVRCKILETVTPGTKHAKGQRGRATVYRWLLLPPVSAPVPAQEEGPK